MAIRNLENAIAKSEFEGETIDGITNVATMTSHEFDVCIDANRRRRTKRKAKKFIFWMHFTHRNGDFSMLRESIECRRRVWCTIDKDVLVIFFSCDFHSIRAQIYQSSTQSMCLNRNACGATATAAVCFCRMHSNNELAFATSSLVFRSLFISTSPILLECLIGCQNPLVDVQQVIQDHRLIDSSRRSIVNFSDHFLCLV